MIKKVLTLFILLCLAGTTTKAQGHYTYREHSQPTFSARDSRPTRGSFVDYFGIRIGLSAARLNANNLSTYMPGLKGQTGLNIGAVYGINFTEEVPAYFELGLKYTEKGARSNTWVTNYETQEKEHKYTYYYDVNYLEMPFVFKYKYALDDNTSIQPFLGGYVAVGVAGKSYEEKSFTNKHFKTFDGGVRLGCGLAITKVYFELALDLGLSNVSQLGEYNSYAKNNNLELNVGLDF